jgi:hypothetical protein
MFTNALRQLRLNRRVVEIIRKRFETSSRSWQQRFNDKKREGKECFSKLDLSVALKPLSKV